MSKKKKNRTGVVYSTNPNYKYSYKQGQQMETLPPGEQKLRTRIETKHRKGKVVTMIAGFVGSESDLKDLAKVLKTRCGTGGSIDQNDQGEMEILIQGDFRSKIKELLTGMGYEDVKP